MTSPGIDLGAELRAGDPRSRLQRDRRGRGQTSIPPECHDVGKSATVPGASVTVPRAVALALGEPKGIGQRACVDGGEPTAEPQSRVVARARHTFGFALKIRIRELGRGSQVEAIRGRGCEAQLSAVSTPELEPEIRGELRGCLGLREERTEAKGQGQRGYPLGFQPDLDSIEAVELVVVGEQLAVERARQQEREGPGPISYFPAVGQASDEVGGAALAAEDIVIELLAESQGRDVVPPGLGPRGQGDCGEREGQQARHHHTPWGRAYAIWARFFRA